MDENVIEQVETVQAGAEAAETLLTDTVRGIRNELERIKDRSENFHSGYESYSVLIKALEDKTATEKDLKDAVKQLWDSVKREDGDVTLAFLGEIERVARESAMAWIRVAAICKKAEESV